MKIHLPSYPRGVHDIRESLGATELDLDPTVFTMPIETHVTLDRHDPYLEFDLEVRTQVISQCDRCVADYTWELTATSPMLYVLGRLPSGEAVDDPEIGYLPVNATDIDLTGDFRDMILLALPGKHLCREDCRGLCPVCGADLNTQECAHAVHQD